MPKEPYYFIDEEDKKKNEILLFVRDAMPGAWRSCASELYNSAELLWNDKDNGLRVEGTYFSEIVDGQLVPRSTTRKIYSVSRSYFLLAGFALENLVKGYLVAVDPTLIHDGKLPKKLREHNLLNLIKKIEGLELDKNEREFCTIAGQAIPYWGRYPIPITFNEVMPEVGLTDDLRQGFLSIYNRIDEILFLKIRDGWDSGVGPKTVKIFDARYDSEEDIRAMKWRKDEI